MDVGVAPEKERVRKVHRHVREAPDVARSHGIGFALMNISSRGMAESDWSFKSLPYDELLRLARWDGIDVGGTSTSPSRGCLIRRPST